MYQIAIDFEENHTVIGITVTEATFKKLKEMGLVDVHGYMRKDDFLRMVEYAYSRKVPE